MIWRHNDLAHFERINAHEPDKTAFQETELALGIRVTQIGIEPLRDQYQPRERAACQPARNGQKVGHIDKASIPERPTITKRRADIAKQAPKGANVNAMGEGKSPLGANSDKWS